MGQQAPNGFTVDVVVAHCREDIEWLWQALSQWTPAAGMRLMLYEKCGVESDVFASTIPTTVVQVIDGEPGGRKDECSAYLTHLARATQSRDVADYTVFLQADALFHTHPRFIHMVMHSIQQGNLNVSFLPLGRSRMITSMSPCRRAIFHQIMGRAPRAAPRGYCCAQFVVERKMLLQAGAVFWQHALEAMDLLPVGREHVDPTRGMHCLVYETMWHVMFGLPEQSLSRGEDVTLPIFLRIPETDETDLPGGANSTHYLRSVVSEESSAWLGEAEHNLSGMMFNRLLRQHTLIRQ